MEVNRRAGAIVFRRTPAGKEFLLLHRVLNWTGWEFPKGGIEEGEDARETAARELGEETGIKPEDIISLEPLDKRVYFTSETTKKRYSHEFFLVEVKPQTKVKLGKYPAEEHDRFEWASKEKALETLSYEHTKKILSEIK